VPGCNGTSYVTLASWNVVAQPVGPTLLLKTPNLATICTGTAVSATFNAGSGGAGCSDDYTVSIDGASGVSLYTRNISRWKCNNKYSDTRKESRLHIRLQDVMEQVM
jgi:hypothetical protein